MRVVIISAAIALSACDPNAAARSHFKYCLGAAAPASAEAIKACHDASWPAERAAQAATKGVKA